MQSTSLALADNANHTCHFWSMGNNRKRKVDASDLEERSSQKIFLTEERLVQNMRTLSLDLSVHNSLSNTLPSQDDAEKKDNQNARNRHSQDETQLELHHLLTDNFKRDDLQDAFINKLYDLERKQLSMQIVPYMPIHPLQLNNSHEMIKEKEQINENPISTSMKTDMVQKDKDDHLFKRPFLPTPYTVEEPCENTIKRTPRMKRSYSQSVRYNSNLNVVELKNDTEDYSVCHAQSDYFILEPSTPASADSSSSRFHPSLLSNKPSLQITEYFDFSSLNTNDLFESLPNDDDDAETQSTMSFDACDKMDDDI